MKHEKMFKVFLIIISILIISLLSISNYKSSVSASSDTAKVVKTFTQLAWLGYDEAMAQTLEQWRYIRACDDYGNLNHSWSQTTQVTCMHGSNTVNYSSSVAQRPYVIIDINTDGYNPLSAKVHIFIEDHTDASDDEDDYFEMKDKDENIIKVTLADLKTFGISRKTTITQAGDYTVNRIDWDTVTVEFEYKDNTVKLYDEKGNLKSDEGITYVQINSSSDGFKIVEYSEFTEKYIEHMKDLYEETSSSDTLVEKVVVIDENGVPEEVKVQPDTKGHWDTKEISDSYLNAMLAYICADAELNNHSNTRWCLSYFWDDSASNVYNKIPITSSGVLLQSYRSYLMQELSNYFGGTSPTILLPNEPNDRSGNRDVSVWNAGLTYISQLKSATNTATYSARIVLFNNGVSEARTVMYGKKNTNEKVSINNYISAVKYPISYTAETLEGTNTLQTTWKYSDWYTISGRKDLLEDRSANSKYAKAVNIIPNTYIKYSIIVESNVSGIKTIKDVFDSSAFDFVSYSANDVDGTSTNGWTLRLFDTWYRR
jgi:hypothetical protein